MEVGTQKEVFTRNKTRAGVEGHYHPCLLRTARVPSQFSPPSGKNLGSPIQHLSPGRILLFLGLSKTRVPIPPLEYYFFPPRIKLKSN